MGFVSLAFTYVQITIIAVCENHKILTLVFFNTFCREISKGKINRCSSN